MILKNILTTSALLLDDPELAKAISVGSSADATIQEKINLLIECTNQINSLIATDYIYLFDTVAITTTGKYPLSRLSNNDIADIASVKDAIGNEVSFSVEGQQLCTISGNFNVKFAYYPPKLTTLTQVIDDYGHKINERIFAYGVVSEYLFIKGNIDDSQMWDSRFKQGILGCIRPKRGRIIKERGWY